MEKERKAAEKVREGRKAYEELKVIAVKPKRVKQKESRFERLKEKAKGLGLSAKERVGQELRERQRKAAEMRKFRGGVEAIAYGAGRVSLAQERGKIRAREEARERARQPSSPYMGNYMLSGLPSQPTSRQGSFIGSSISSYLGFPERRAKPQKPRKKRKTGRANIVININQPQKKRR